MIRIIMHVEPTDESLKWSPVVAERDGGWAVVIDGNRMICAIGDPLDGESVSAFVPPFGFSAEWRIDGYAHELWVDGVLRNRLIERREFLRGEQMHIGSDPWHPHRVFAGTVSVEVIDG